jgi:hypothetical protein
VLQLLFHNNYIIFLCIIHLEFGYIYWNSNSNHKSSNIGIRECPDMHAFDSVGKLKIRYILPQNCFIGVLIMILSAKYYCFRSNMLM